MTNKEKILAELKKVWGALWLNGCEPERDTIDAAIEMLKNSSVSPEPCIQLDGRAVKEWMIKECFLKIDEELNELKAIIMRQTDEMMLDQPIKDIAIYGDDAEIAEEAADTITAITSMLEAMGIDKAMRDEAQRRVNKKNRERGRLEQRVREKNKQ